MRSPARAVATLVTSLVAAGCGIFPPVGELEVKRLDVAWATELYQLEEFAYHASDTGQPLYIRSMATPEAGLVVVPSKDRAVRGVDAADGRVVWEIRTQGPNAARPVAMGPEDVIVASMDGHVYRINPRNGRPQWVSDEPGTSMTASPVVAGTLADGSATVFVTSIDGRLVALDGATGKRKWEQSRPLETELSMTGQAGPALVGKSVVTGFADGHVVAYAQEDGVTLWSTPLGGDKKEFVDVDTTPLLVTEGKQPMLLVGSFKRGLFGLTPDHGDVQWSIKGEGFQTGVADGVVAYVPQSNGRVWAVEADTGSVRWIADLGTGWATTPMVSRKYVLVPAGDGLAVLDKGSGREHVRWNDGRAIKATPELAFGQAWVVASSGKLYALGVY
ncbi:MAG: PQQ-binding-like beta-propeller repeat protein [Deltaproteobacteria bacterium]|nr:PQQ-binding-like beta-propeller repeat protein [Deltaproteobacteria bacterium]